jgi:hypothetical protein
MIWRSRKRSLVEDLARGLARFGLRQVAMIGSLA